MKNERTQRDHDIIRQSSLKAAVDLTIGMLPQLEDQTEISDLVLRVAGKFQNWVLNGQSNPVQDKVDGIRDELEQPPPIRPGKTLKTQKSAPMRCTTLC